MASVTGMVDSASSYTTDGGSSAPRIWSAKANCQSVWTCPRR